MSTEDRIERARALHERAVFGGEAGALDAADAELDAVEADLALARGRIVHERLRRERAEHPREASEEDPLELFERAARLYRALGDVRGEGEALLWTGLFHQVIRRDDATAVPLLERSRELAERTGDRLTLSYALRHLGVAEHRAGRLDAARERLEESTRLRREIGLLPGVAANMVGLAYIAAADGRHDEASALIEEASAIAGASGAHAVARQLEEARTQVSRD
ncbi:tetratricopeptide repeat protein [Streptosporangium longisporum]|uniref:MalT-like TPR region domain-containing protein n=1 Tax=Streptosporangium longisporum TaxID=46187 RepID=A0ABN3YDF8_9ACTN